MLKNSSLMRRTVFLVLAALVASTIFSAVAFSVAGRVTEYSSHIESASEQANEVVQMVEEMDYENNLFLSRYICGRSDLTGKDIYIMNPSGTIMIPTGGLYSHDYEEYVMEARKEIYAEDFTEFRRSSSDAGRSSSPSEDGARSIRSPSGNC